MTIPSGECALSDIQAELGGTNPISLSEYYARLAGVPTSGQISISQFRGKSVAPAGGWQQFTPGVYLFNVPNYASNFNIVTVGAGGGGTGVDGDPHRSTAGSGGGHSAVSFNGGSDFIYGLGGGAGGYPGGGAGGGAAGGNLFNTAGGNGGSGGDLSSGSASAGWGGDSAYAAGGKGSGQAGGVPGAGGAGGKNAHSHGGTLFTIVGGGGGAGGRAQSNYPHTSIPPGSVLRVTVGAGGARGNISGGTDGGAGGNGMVWITWA